MPLAISTRPRFDSAMEATATQPRTWDATITFTDKGVETTVEATASQWDTLSETTKATIAEAAEFLREGLATEARVNLYKTTKKRGREFDRQGAYLWVEGAKVMVQR